MGDGIKKNKSKGPWTWEVEIENESLWLLLIEQSWHKLSNLFYDT